jgi:hypothetical protein
LFALTAVSEIILQEGEAFDFALIMQLVSAFSVRPSSELKGFISVVCQFIPLPHQQFSCTVNAVNI